MDSSQRHETRATRWLHPASARFAWGASWLIDAPWAHPVWPQYLLLLFELRSPVPDHTLHIHLTGATHELQLYAMDPETPLAHDKPLQDQRRVPLHPMNYGYQFRAADDDAALKRIQAVVDAIGARRLSPDTDYRSTWDAMFSDAFPLVRNGLVEMFGAPPGRVN